MTTYDRFLERVKKIHTLVSISRFLGWDSQTMMPPNGSAARAEQLALIRGTIHELLIDDQMGEWLAELREAKDLSEEQAANVREMAREYDRSVRVPQAFVEEMTRVTTMAKKVWAQARQANDFSEFAPHLARIVEMKREEAGYIGYEENPYDALLDTYEPGLTAKAVAEMFAPLREDVTELLRRIHDAPTQPDVSLLERPLSEEKQREFGVRIARDFGFDFESGRLDTAAHPFCSGIHPGDVRITTRYNPKEPLSSLFAILHETGHGLYDQGLNREYTYTPLGESASLGIHESQSRFWENIIGRSRPFWEHYLPDLKRIYEGELDDVTLDAFHFAVNAVRPGLIRVEADELTYNLHILLRFEIEDDLINERLKVEDVPEAWDAKMEAYLGLKPTNDARGCLQDIHWSMGAFGYFPTYTIGNLYAAQLAKKIWEDIPDVEEQIRGGRFAEILRWLRERIHRHGKRYTSAELIEHATGEPPRGEYFVRYVREKYTALYHL